MYVYSHVGDVCGKYVYMCIHMWEMCVGGWVQKHECMCVCVCVCVCVPMCMCVLYVSVHT